MLSVVGITPHSDSPASLPVAEHHCLLLLLTVSGLAARARLPPPGSLECAGLIRASLSHGGGWGGRERADAHHAFRPTPRHFHCIVLDKVRDTPAQLQGADLLSHFATCIATERPIIRVISATSAMH